MKRPKKVDVDKPTGYIKYKLKRWLRLWVKRQARTEILEDQLSGD
jgi:predicted nucleotidyltransferase